MPIEDAMARAGGFVGMDPTTPADYAPIAGLDIPDAASYVLRDVDLGAEFFDVTPDDALPEILARGRSPLTIDEGVAVLVQFPDVLTDGERVLAARLPPRRPARARALGQRRPAAPGLVLGRRAALVARRRVMPSARRLTRCEACAAWPG